jgi:putative membrane protein
MNTEIFDMPFLRIIAHWFVSALALAITAAMTPGFRLGGFGTALIASVAIGAANYFVKPILIFLTFPLTIITLGLFLIVVDAMILRICASMLKDFEITNWLSAIIGSLVLALFSTILHTLFV